MNDKTTPESGAMDTVNGVPVARRILLRGISAWWPTARSRAFNPPRMSPRWRRWMPNRSWRTRESCASRFRADAHPPPDQDGSRLPPQAPALNATIEEQTVIEYAEVNVAVALALPSDDLLAVVIKRADECATCRDRDPAADAPAASGGRRSVHRRCSGRDVYSEQLRHAAPRHLGNARAHPGTGCRTSALAEPHRGWYWMKQIPEAGVCGGYSRSRSPTTTAS